MKDDLSSLAIFGGIPAFSETLHVGRPNIGKRDQFIARVKDLLDRHLLTNDGPYVQELERRIAELIGVNHCVAMCNATVALEIAIRALELNGEVIVPSFTFIATAHALQWQQIIPVFCDLDPLTHNLDPESVKQALTPRTSAIIGVHLWGRPCNTEALEEIANKNNLRLIFDAAHAFGSSHRKRMIGSFGDAEVFSFHATKFINSFEGGAVVTNNDRLARKMRLMRNFGFADYDLVLEIGTNGKMSEVSAAMALSGLESMDELIALNHRNYHLYRRELEGVRGISFVTYDDNEKNNYQYIVLEIEEKTTQVSRDQLLKILWAENVRARRYFYPGCHRMEPYRTLYPEASRTLQETERLTSRVLVLPTGTCVTPGDISKLCGIIKLVLNNGSLVDTMLRERTIA